MNVVVSNLIAAAPPMVVAAALLGAVRARRGRIVALWLVFGTVSLLWASLIVPLPSSNGIRTHDEWLRRLSYIALMPAGVFVGGALLYARQRRVARAATRPGFGVVTPPNSDRS